MTLTLNASVKPKRAKQPGKQVFPRRDLGLGISVQILDITSTMADDWLHKRMSRIQRPVSEVEVDMLNRHITSGKWLLNGETIVFDTNNECINGRRRLTACARSGKPIRSIVVWGIPSAAYHTIDVGLARKNTDALRSAGIHYESAVSAACQILFRYEKGMPIAPTRKIGRYMLSPIEILDLAKKYKGLEEYALKASKAAKVLHSLGVATSLYYLVEKIDSDQAYNFFEGLGTGSNLAKGSPVLTLRDRVMPTRLDTDVVAHMSWLAWNAFRENKPLRFEFMRTRPLPKLV